MTTRVYSFRSLADAQHARDALVRDGFTPERLRLRSLGDEAGPVEGNFVVGDGRTVDKLDPPGALEGRGGPYEWNLARQVDRGSQLLEVDSAGDADAARARAVAREHHGVDLAERDGSER